MEKLRNNNSQRWKPESPFSVQALIMDSCAAGMFSLLSGTSVLRLGAMLTDGWSLDDEAHSLVLPVAAFVILRKCFLFA